MNTTIKICEVLGIPMTAKQATLHLSADRPPELIVVRDIILANEINSITERFELTLIAENPTQETIEEKFEKMRKRIYARIDQQCELALLRVHRDATNAEHQINRRFIGEEIAPSRHKPIGELHVDIVVNADRATAVFKELGEKIKATKDLAESLGVQLYA